MYRTHMAILVLACSAIGAPAGAQECPGGFEPRPTLGIGHFHCQGGTCVVGGAIATMQTEARRPPLPPAPERGIRYGFSTEPHLWRVRPDGPAAGRVKGGDVLVAVDGAPVTTREAGRRLSAMLPGKPVELLLRRDRRLVEVKVRPESSCEILHVTVGSEPRPRSLSEAGGGQVPGDPAPAASWEGTPGPTSVIDPLGVALLGETVVQVAASGDILWWFSEDPVVISVKEGGPAERAGIRPGMVLLTVEGHALRSAEGTALLGRSARGSPLSIRIRWSGQEREIVIPAGS